MKKYLFSIVLCVTMFLITTPLIASQSQYYLPYNPNYTDNLQSKVANVDSYSGKVNLRIPIINKPINNSLSLMVNVTNKRMAQTTYLNPCFSAWCNGNSYINQIMGSGGGLGDQDGVMSGLSSFNTDVDENHFYANKFLPLFSDPQGESHLFYPASQSGNYYSRDGWKAELSSKIVDIGNQTYITVYSGKLYSPNGLIYQTLNSSFNIMSPLSEITVRGSPDWIKYNYTANDTEISNITTSDGYQVNFSYSTIQIFSGDPDIYRRYITSITTSDGKIFNFSYSGGFLGYKNSYLNQITLPDQTKWVLTPAFIDNFHFGYLSTLTYPNGASQSFTYGLSSSLHLGVYVTSETSLKLFPYGKTTYSYLDNGNISTTTAILGNKQIQYTFENPALVTHQFPWNSGLLDSEKIIDLSTKKTVKSITNTWSSRKLSDQVGGSQPLLTKKVIAQDGATYTTENKNFDNYGYPLQTVETGSDTRIINRTYYQDVTNWIFKLKTEQITNASGVAANTHSNKYNALGQLTSSATNGVATTYTYDANGNIATKTDALGHVTTYKNYVAGHPTEVIGPKITDTGKPAFDDKYTVNPSGTIASYTDSWGNQTVYSYDLLDRLTSITKYKGLASGGVQAELPTTIQWDIPKLGDQTVTIGNQVHQNLYRIEKDGTLVKIETDFDKSVFTNPSTDPHEADTMIPAYEKFVEITYDAYGDQMTTDQFYDHMSSPVAPPEDWYWYLNHRLSYDILGRILTDTTAEKVIDRKIYDEETVSYLTPQQRTYSYGANSQTTTDPNSHSTMYTYQNFSTPANSNVISVKNALGNITTTQRDVVGRALSVTQGKLVHTYTYDPTQHFYLTSSTAPEIGTVSYGRNILGEMTSKTINNQATNYVYDEVGNLTHVNYPDNDSAKDNISLTYNYGRLQSKSNINGSWSYGYDALGNMASAVYQNQSKKYSFVFSYDNYNHLSSMTYPDGKVYQYNPNDYTGKPTQIGDAIKVNYNKNGQYGGYGVNSTAVMIGNGITYDYLGRVIGAGGSAIKVPSKKLDGKHFNNFQDLLKLAKNNPSLPIFLYSTKLDHDLAGNIIKITDGTKFMGDLKVENISYDASNQLLSASGDLFNTSYQYDQNGNITKLIRNGATLDYHYNASNLLTSISGSEAQAYHYDSYGNISGINNNVLTFNAANQLIEAKAAGKTINYTYDANGNRIGMDDGTHQLFSLYLNNHLIYSESGSDKTNYLYAGHWLVAKSTNGVNHYIISDYLGSPVREVDNTNINFKWSQQYTPYGKELNQNTEQSTHHIGFTGKVFDNDIGLNYMNARYYDPEIGRFISYDPAGIDPSSPLTFNRYAYAANNPYTYIDPTGMFSWGGLWNGIVHNFENIGIGFSYGASGGMIGAGMQGQNGFDYVWYYGGMAAGTAVGMTGGSAEEGMAVRGATYIGENTGMISNDVASTFMGNKYKTYLLNEDTQLYRAGVQGKPFGQFFSKDAPISEIQTRIDKAILPKWPNGAESPINTAYKLSIPKGTYIHVGEVGYQGNAFVGASEQIYVHEPWNINGVKVLDSYPLG
ncbi:MULTISPECIES: RHS repeat domain-containing protein [Cysteiniphilum]|uniref:RHS repeat domain-containing protein n=1 Tax=Cysteiniphilum TaxID=2056696 RepID=UPI00177DD085|nr:MULTISPECIES: RHS repeat-associated core domain-containing protein [Cysteiniphilum]